MKNTNVFCYWTIKLTKIIPRIFYKYLWPRIAVNVYIQWSSINCSLQAMDRMSPIPYKNNRQKYLLIKTGKKTGRNSYCSVFYTQQGIEVYQVWLTLEIFMYRKSWKCYHTIFLRDNDFQTMVEFGVGDIEHYMYTIWQKAPSIICLARTLTMMTNRTWNVQGTLYYQQ